MKRQINILLFFLLLSMNMAAQIEYDTIPRNDIISTGLAFEELFIFRDFRNQTLNYFENIDFKTLDCYGEKVFVETVFGKAGELKNTRIVKSASPICDSLAFNFVNGLYGWLPGLQRGRFVDIPFIFPIFFDSLNVKNRYVNSDLFFIATEEEYRKRKEYFDFYYSENYEQKITSDYRFFKNYIAEVFRNKHSIFIHTDYKINRKKSVVLKVNATEIKNTHLLVYDIHKDWIIYEYNLKNKEIRIPKDKELFLIFYREGDTPLIQTKTINSMADSAINLELEEYTKGRLLEELKKYSP